MATLKQLEDITECPICTEMFTEPRVLPCIHTYCLKCIVEYGKAKNPGDIMPCPLCRNDFTIPASGMKGLPCNFFMEKLLDMKDLSTAAEQEFKVCDVCGSYESTAQSTVAAEYCVDCQQHLCVPCGKVHRKMKGTFMHKTVELGSEVRIDELVKKFRTPVCTKHPGKEIEVYCLQCNEAVCMMCYMKLHNSHIFSEVDEVADEFRNQIGASISSIAERAHVVAELLPKYDKMKQDFEKEMLVVEQKICDATEQLINRINRDRKALLVELETLKKDRMKILESVRQDVEHHVVALESFKKYCDELKSKGSACDVARSASSLKARSKELLDFVVSSHVLVSSKSVETVFSSSLLLARETGNVIGSVVVNERLNEASTVSYASAAEYVVSSAEWQWQLREKHPVVDPSYGVGYFSPKYLTSKGRKGGTKDRRFNSKREGYAAGTHHTSTNGGVNTLCLHDNPQWGMYNDAAGFGNYILGAEYRFTDMPFSTTNNDGSSLFAQDVPCIACHSPLRSTQIMIPARR